MGGQYQTHRHIMKYSSFKVVASLLALSTAQRSAPLAGYGVPGGVAVDPALLALSEAIPGSPGDDYPIFNTIPETSFQCDSYIEGYYADPETECQAFHICGNDGNGGLIKYSFLCPNGTLFNQQYFICDWWFNFDCSQAEDLYSINEEVAAAAAAATAAQALAQGGRLDLDLSINARSQQLRGQGVQPRNSGRRQERQSNQREFEKDEDVRLGSSEETVEANGDFPLVHTLINPPPTNSISFINKGEKGRNKNRNNNRNKNRPQRVVPVKVFRRG